MESGVKYSHRSMDSSVEVKSNIETHALRKLQSLNGRVKSERGIEPVEVLGGVHLAEDKKLG